MAYGEQILPVESYATPDVAPGLDYPGKRPIGSFITDGMNARLLPESFNTFVQAADGQLAIAGLPPIADRTPVLSYGANASPPRLRDKLAKFGADHQALMQTVPHVSAVLPGMNAVWHGRPAQNGSVFAELHASDNPDDNIQAHVAFLTPEQLAAIHISEGATYSAARMHAALGAESLETDTPVRSLTPIMGYIALDASILTYGNKPVLVDGLHQKANCYMRMSPEQAVQYMLNETQETHGFTTVEALMAAMKSKTLAAKKQQQAEIGAALLEKGISRRYVFPQEHAELIGRADFSPVGLHDNHGFIHLPDITLAKIRPTHQAVAVAASERMARNPKLSPAQAWRAAKRTLDPAAAITSRAHDQLAIQLQNY